MTKSIIHKFDEVRRRYFPELANDNFELKEEDISPWFMVLSPDNSIRYDRSISHLPNAHLEWLFCHELSHYVLGHTKADYDFKKKEREADAETIRRIGYERPAGLQTSGELK